MQVTRSATCCAGSRQDAPAATSQPSHASTVACSGTPSTSQAHPLNSPCIRSCRSKRARSLLWSPFSITHDRHLQAMTWTHGGVSPCRKQCWFWLWQCCRHARICRTKAAENGQLPTAQAGDGSQEAPAAVPGADVHLSGRNGHCLLAQVLDQLTVHLHQPLIRTQDFSGIGNETSAAEHLSG